MMKDGSYASIGATLKPAKVDALKNVVTSSKINNVNLCTDVLTYTEEKAFTSKLALSGGLTVGNVLLDSREGKQSVI